MRGALLVFVALIVVAGSAPRASGRPDPARQTTQATQPSNRADPQRLADLTALIEGPNSPQVRLTGATELLRQGWTETPARVAAILAGADAAARTAIAAALTSLPQHFDASYVEPLLAMLGDADAAARLAACGALTCRYDASIAQKLRVTAADAGAAPLRRQSAVTALGMLTDRDAVEALIACLNGDAEWNARVLVALENAAGQSFASETEARNWWRETRDVSSEQWRQQQVARLAARNRSLTQQLAQLRGQLLKSLRDGYFRTASGDRAALLSSYLNDADAAIRLLSLDLIRGELADRSSLPDELLRQVRGLMNGAETRVRVAAIGVVAGLRDLADEATFLAMLPGETEPDVRTALINGLGYVGDSEAVGPLLALFADPSEAIAVEAVAAVGRLAERDAIGETGVNGEHMDAAQVRAKVADALMTRFDAAPRERALLRERILWAMSRAGDPRFGPYFERASAADEPAAVRQAAVLGIDALGDAARLDAVLPAMADADAGLRKSAIDVVARLGTSDAHLSALWGHIGEAQEPNAKLRDAAWQGALHILSTRPSDVVREWAGRLSDDSETSRRRAVELLSLAERSLAAETPANRTELGALRVDIGRRWAALGRADQSVAMLARGVDDLHAIKSPETSAVAAELVTLALDNDLYTPPLAAGLAQLNPALDGAVIWRLARGIVEPLLRPETAERAATMLSLLQSTPPTTMPAEAAAAMSELANRARALREGLTYRASSTSPTTRAAETLPRP